MPPACPSQVELPQLVLEPLVVLRELHRGVDGPCRRALGVTAGGAGGLQEREKSGGDLVALQKSSIIHEHFFKKLIGCNFLRTFHGLIFSEKFNDLQIVKYMLILI